jgi:hypothetical protein
MEVTPAVGVVARVLCEEFAGRVPSLVVIDVVETVASHFEDARIPQYVPLLIEREARVVLTRLADEDE